MKNAVIYARYSSDSQNEQSIEGQLRVCEKYAKDNDIIIMETYIDRAMTGTNDNRAAFQKMIHDSFNRQWEYVIVYKLDRFSRNKYESAMHKKTLKDNGVKLLSATELIPDGPEGIILESLLEGMAQYYSAELSQKVKRGINENFLKGKFIGGTLPYGYKVVNGFVSIDEDEAPYLKEIFVKYANGYPVTAIINDLENAGISRKKGKPFTLSSVRRMLSNQKYIGITIHENTKYTNMYPRLIPDSIWNKVQDIINTNKEIFTKNYTCYKYLLSEKLICGECGAHMFGRSGRGRHGENHFYYSCSSTSRNAKACSNKYIVREKLEKIVFDIAESCLTDTSIIDKITDTIMALHKDKRKENLALRNLIKKRDEALTKSNNLMAAVESGLMTEQTKVRLQTLESELNKLNYQISHEEQRSYTFLTEKEIRKFLSSIITKTNNSEDIKKAIVKIFIREIILYKEKLVIAFNFIDNPDPPNCDKNFIKDIEATMKNTKKSRKTDIKANSKELALFFNDQYFIASYNLSNYLKK